MICELIGEAEDAEVEYLKMVFKILILHRSVLLLVFVFVFVL